MPDLDSIFRPRGIAIIGASPNSNGARQIVSWLRHMNYDGGIYPVNPKYEDFEGLRCYPSPKELPDGVTTAAIVTGASSAVSLLGAAGAAGIKGATIYAVGFNEAGEDGLELEEELLATARQYDMAVVGPNCMGALAPAYGSSLYSGSVEDPEILAGSTGLISQSGSAAIALLGISERVGGWSLVASSGNETVCTASDYLEYMVEDERTERIAMFLESVREPERFAKAAIRARELGKPLIALKVGKSDEAKKNVKAHTGALAGSARAASAFFRKCGVMEVESLGELIETVVVFSQKIAPQGRKLGAIHPSGGEASLLLDAAEPLGLEFPPLSPEGRDKLVEELHPWFAGARNPLDAWGPIPYTASYEGGLDVLGAQEDLDAIILLHDSAGSTVDRSPEVGLNIIGYGRATQERYDKPVFLLSNLHADLEPAVADALRDAGIPGLVGTATGLRAIRHWLDFHEMQRDSSPEEAAPAIVSVEGLSLPDGPGSLNEVRAKAVFAQFGIPAPRETMAATVDDALRAAEQIGYPVVLKAIGSALEHKTDLGLVRVGIERPQALKDACADLTHRLQDSEWDGFLVAEQVTDAREVVVGATRDPTYGLTVVVGAGGIFTEVLDDAALAIPPVTREVAHEMVASLRSAPTLGEWRGRAPADVEALCDAIVAMGELARSLGDRLESAEINPLAVLPKGQGVQALDALIVLR